MPKITVAQALKKCRNAIQEVAGIASQAEAKFMLGAICNCKPNNLAFFLNDKLDLDATAKLKDYIKQRCENKPLAYILKQMDFMNLNLYIDERVLIPRADTEIVVLAALEELGDKNKAYQIADIGTGSGAIALMLAQSLPKATVWAVDYDENVLEVAKLNAKRNKINKNINFLKGDLLEPLNRTTQKFDLIISNPPYLDKSEMINLDHSVKNYEPATALYGGEDGLDYYRRLAKDAPEFLTKQGILLVEIGYRQEEAIRFIWQKAGFSKIKSGKDLNNNYRWVSGRKI